MTAKLKTPSSSLSKYEKEVERLRNENKWGKLQEFASSYKDQKMEILSKFCKAESELENYLFINPIIFSSNSNESSSVVFQSQTSKSPDVMNNIEKSFKEVINKTDNAYLSIETCILLAKLYYSQMRLDEASSLFDRDNMHSIMNEQIKNLKRAQNTSGDPLQSIKSTTHRQLQLFAEAHSIKGLCLERKQFNNMSTNINYKSTNECKNEDQHIIDSFELSSLIAIKHSLLMLQYLSKKDRDSKTTNEPTSSGTSNMEVLSTNIANVNLNSLNNADDNLDLINPLYEIALQKAPLLYIKRGDLQMGMRMFRDLLLKKNIQSITSIRQVLLKKFAECLMFNIAASQYNILREPSINEKYKPLFKPHNQDEEILLCLVLSQYLASKEVMLLRQPQFKQIREHTFNNSINSLDLLVYYLSYHRSYNVLIDKFEMAMKYSFEQFYVWYQYGLTLMCDQKFYKAYLVFKESARMKPTHIPVHLMLAKLAVEHLFFIDEAIEWSMKVIEISSTKNTKAYILLGCSLCIKAKLQKKHADQKALYDRALDSFKKAHSLDQTDYLPLYHLAHYYAINRQINESLECIQKSLKLKADDKDSLHLLTLLLTATKNYDEAHVVISKACALYEDFELMFTKIRTEEILYGFSQSANSILSLILFYKQKLQGTPKERFGSTCSSSIVSAAQPVPIMNKTANTTNNPNDWSSFESASLLSLQQAYKLNDTIGKTVTMLIQNDQISYKYGNSVLESHNVQTLLVLIRILCQIGEFYLRHDKLSDAEMCCQEIANNHPLSYLHIYLRGRIFEYKKDYTQAKSCYQNALSINPHHIPSLQQMSLVLCHMENFHLAEKMIRDAISLNSSLPDSWHILARVLDYLNDNQQAMNCYQTCLQLEATYPILPFSSLTKVLD